MYKVYKDVIYDKNNTWEKGDKLHKRQNSYFEIKLVLI